MLNKEAAKSRGKPRVLRAVLEGGRKITGACWHVLIKDTTGIGHIGNAAEAVRRAGMSVSDPMGSRAGRNVFCWRVFAKQKA